MTPTLVSLNPSREGVVVGEVPVSSRVDVHAAMEAAHGAKALWRGLGIRGRVVALQRIVDAVEGQKERLSLLIAEEMGMALKEAREDVGLGCDYLRSYMETAETHLAPMVTYETEDEIHEVFREPYGVVAVIVPWNFPFSNFVWQAGQNLVAGNVVVFKHSEETPMFSRALEEIITQSGLPAGVFSVVYGDGAVGAMLIEEDINLLCFTGSTKVGQQLNEAAARKFIPTLLELGGSAPGIVFEDADIESVKDALYLARFMNCGQLCDAPKRLIVHKSKVDEVVRTLRALLETKTVGDATDETTDIGPLVAERQRHLLVAQMDDAREKGATVIVGGKSPVHLKGAYYEPTLLINVTTDMHIWQEEVFGPVLPIVTFTDETEAIRLANDTKYGLGGYIFTQDNARFQRVAAALETGMVSQNSVTYINVRNPFGGYKMSGHGREHAGYGFAEVTQPKLVSREK